MTNRLRSAWEMHIQSFQRSKVLKLHVHAHGNAECWMQHLRYLCYRASKFNSVSLSATLVSYSVFPASSSRRPLRRPVIALSVLWNAILASSISVLGAPVDGSIHESRNYVRKSSTGRFEGQTAPVLPLTEPGRADPQPALQFALEPVVLVLVDALVIY